MTSLDTGQMRIIFIYNVFRNSLPQSLREGTLNWMQQRRRVNNTIDNFEYVNLIKSFIRFSKEERVKVYFNFITYEYSPLSSPLSNSKKEAMLFGLDVMNVDSIERKPNDHIY